MKTVADRWLGYIAIGASAIVAGLAVAFDSWTWLKAVAAGLAAGGLVAAAFYTREQARYSRKQAETAETALANAREEAADRTKESLRAQEVAQATLRESVKSRLDAMAPKVSVVMEHSEMMPGLFGPDGAYDAWNELPAEVPASTIEGRRLRVGLGFTIRNHGDLPVPMFLPGNPLTLETTDMKQGHNVLMPGKATLLQYFIEMDFVRWRQAMREGFGPMAHPDNGLMLTFNFQFTDSTGQLLDTHTWRGEIHPFEPRDDGSVQRSDLPVNGPMVANVGRTYVGLPSDEKPSDPAA